MNFHGNNDENPALLKKNETSGSVEKFRGIIRPYVVVSALMMVNFELLSQAFNSFVDEVCALITHKDLRASKSGYDIIKYEPCSCSCTTILNCSYFFPSGQILCSSDDVSRCYAFSWWVDQPHKVNSPFLKCL
jgi:hypothetical protein